MSSPLADPALDEKLAAASRTLTVIAGAMGMGVLMLCAVVAFFRFSATGRAPTPDSLRTINLLTTIAMAYALGGIFVSEMLWRTRVRVATAENAAATVQTAFILRAAVREGAALLGAVVALMAAQGGILALYPAYWANLAPCFLFGTFLFAHWPSAANLKAELSDALGGVAA